LTWAVWSTCRTKARSKPTGATASRNRVGVTIAFGSRPIRLPEGARRLSLCRPRRQAVVRHDLFVGPKHPIAIPSARDPGLLALLLSADAVKLGLNRAQPWRLEGSLDPERVWRGGSKPRIASSW